MPLKPHLELNARYRQPTLATYNAEGALSCMKLKNEDTYNIASGTRARPSTTVGVKCRESSPVWHK